MKRIDSMEQDSVQIELPLEARFQLRKIEVDIQEYSLDELQQAYLKLVWQQMMERKAIAAVLKANDIDIIFDAPSEDIVDQLAELCEGDNDEPFDFFHTSY